MIFVFGWFLSCFCCCFMLVNGWHPPPPKDQLLQEGTAYPNINNIPHLTKVCFMTIWLQNCSHLYGWQNVTSETCQDSENPTLTLKHRVCTLFRNKFPGLFQDSDWILKGSNIHINPPKDLNVNSPYCLPYTSYFLAEFNRLPELSRTSGLFPELSRPGKCHNKISGLSRFSRTRTNPVKSFRLWHRKEHRNMGPCDYL